MNHGQPPRRVYVVVSANGPEYVSRTRRGATAAAACVMRGTTVVRYDRAEDKAAKNRTRR